MPIDRARFDAAKDDVLDLLTSNRDWAYTAEELAGALKLRWSDVSASLSGHVVTGKVRRKVIGCRSYFIAA